jgi:uncharacterized protein YdaU (DUF1376 family)
MFYYTHHIGDFVRDTSRLSDAQCMAYLRLIWAYYDTEHPLDTTPEKLAFQVGASVDDVRQILEHYFVFQDGKYFHTRCEKEIAHFHSKSLKASASANARWKNAKGMRTHNERIANDSKTDANQEPITKNHINTPDGVSDSVWQDFKAIRKAKKAPITQRVVDGLRAEAEKAGWTFEQALTECCLRGWQAFKADWVKDRHIAKQDIVHTTVPSNPNRDPALAKLDADRQITKPPSVETLARIAEYRKSVAQ